MDSTLKKQLQEWAKEYNQPKYFQEDPCQFPHRFKKEQDIEISGFLASWISYGKREQIVAKCEIMHQLIGNNPFEFIKCGPDSFTEIKERAEQKGSRNTFYRFYTYHDLYQLLCRLHEIYKKYDSLEDAVIDTNEVNIVHKLSLLFEGIKGIPTIKGNSAHKRIALFLRWMVRQDRIVDFGIWERVASPKDLIIPLDTHVLKTSIKWGLTKRKDASWKTAREITKAMTEVFPEDPCLGDFALFGEGINEANHPTQE